MNLRRITAAILAAFAFAAAGFATALPAAASVRPVVVYTQGMEGGWNGPAVRPAWIDFGADWIFLSNPPAKSIHWTHWTVRSAYGSGRYLLSDGCCQQVLNYPADIALTDVQHHGSTAYFRDATITARGHRTIHLWYGAENTPYGPLIGWHGSAVG
jgi:hypothetical protein